MAALSFNGLPLDFQVQTWSLSPQLDGSNDCSPIKELSTKL